jgi:hypothetical protein
VGAIAVATIALVFAGERPAAAVEREHHFGADLGGGLLVIKDKSTNDLGGSVGVHYTYGLSDEFNLMAEGSWSLLALGQEADSKKTPHDYPSWLGNADVGIGYVFDVLQWVPYAGVLVGGYALSGGTIQNVKVLLGAEVALGLDYRLSPTFSIGVAARQHFMTEMSTYPSFTQGFVRAEYVWGW